MEDADPLGARSPDPTDWPPMARQPIDTALMSHTIFPSRRCFTACYHVRAASSRTDEQGSMTTSPSVRSHPAAARARSALAAVLIAALATAGCRTTPVAKDKGSPTAAGMQSGVVRVQAEGRTEAVPDMAVLGTSGEITGTSAAAARDRAARLMQTVIDELKLHGVDDQDIQTKRFTIQPEYQYANDGTRRLNGYPVVHGLAVTIRNPDTLGATVDAVSEVAGDALAFRHIEFIHADPERHRAAARRDAADRLHRTARQLAEASNRELGPLLEISEGVSTDYGPYQSLSAGAAMLRSEAVDTPISVGSDVIRLTVRGVFALR